MVRINLIPPKNLADQHLIAEYNEILMLLGYIRNNPSLKNIPEKYCLGKGHIKFFKNKILYLKNRHELIKKEMKNRKFKTNITINLNEFDENLIKNWSPQKADIKIIKNRLKEKILNKPKYYRYNRVHRNLNFFLKLIN